MPFLRFHSWRVRYFKVDLRLEPYSTTFSDLFFRNIRLNNHIEIIWNQINHMKSDEKLQQRVTVRNMSTIHHIFMCSKWLLSILSQNRALSKIALRIRRKICGLIVRQARTILSFRSSTLAGRVNLLFNMILDDVEPYISKK